VKFPNKTPDILINALINPAYPILPHPISECTYNYSDAPEGCFANVASNSLNLIRKECMHEKRMGKKNITECRLRDYVGLFNCIINTD
jgi:hypothetical protein